MTHENNKKRREFLEEREKSVRKKFKQISRRMASMDRLAVTCSGESERADEISIASSPSIVE
ncbi:MAG: hypothetical protein GF408_04755 [Candidatus Omnitrophica bacterium]|nr:hypothetical protein [Candidatus Omnitrophota bacterium]